MTNLKLGYADLFKADITNSTLVMLFLCTQHIRIYRSPLNKRISRIKCNDGFSVSVQVGRGCASTPNRSCRNWYTEVELQYPTALPQYNILEHLNGNDWDKDRYFNVPIEHVVDLLNTHGGINWVKTLNRTLFSPNDILVLFEYLIGDIKTNLYKNSYIVLNTLLVSNAKLTECKPITISLHSNNVIVFSYIDRTHKYMSDKQFTMFYKENVFAIKLAWVEDMFNKPNESVKTPLTNILKSMFPLLDVILA